MRWRLRPCQANSLLTVTVSPYRGRPRESAVPSGRLTVLPTSDTSHDEQDPYKNGDAGDEVLGVRFQPGSRPCQMAHRRLGRFNGPDLHDEQQRRGGYDEHDQRQHRAGDADVGPQHVECPGNHERPRRNEQPDEGGVAGGQCIALEC